MFRLRRVIIRLINLRTTIHYTLYSIIYVSFALGIPYALHCVSSRPGFLLSNSVKVYYGWFHKTCETIHPGTKEGAPQKEQEPNPTHRRSEGPYHNLEKIVSTHQQNPHRHTHLNNHS